MMRNRQRRGGAGQGRHRRQRHLRAGRARQIEFRQDRGIALVDRHRFQHHPVLVGLAVDGGNLPLREGVVQGVVDGLDADAELAGALAVDVERGAQAAVLGLRRDVAEQRIAAQFGHQLVGPQAHQRRVGAGQRVLVLRAARLGRDLHVLHRLEIDRHARDRRRPLPSGARSRRKRRRAARRAASASSPGGRHWWSG